MLFQNFDCGIVLIRRTLKILERFISYTIFSKVVLELGVRLQLPISALQCGPQWTQNNVLFIMSLWNFTVFTQTDTFPNLNSPLYLGTGMRYIFIYLQSVPSDGSRSWQKCWSSKISYPIFWYLQMRHCKLVHQSQLQNCATFTSNIWSILWKTNIMFFPLNT